MLLFVCRKKRKWDQPAESLVNYPLGNMGSLAGVLLPVVAPSVSAAAAFLTNPIGASGVAVPPVALQGPSVLKLNQVRYVASWGFLIASILLHIS